MNINFFVNDKFRVAAYLYDMRTPDNKSYVTQQEISDALKIGRVTINRILSALRENGFLDVDGNHNGRYTLTDEAIDIIETFRNSTKI